MLHRTISQISSFLLEFAKSTRSCPQFRRLGIDMSVLEQFGVGLDELKAAIAYVQQSTIQINDGDESPQKGTGVDSRAIAIKPLENKYFDNVKKEESVKFPSPQMVRRKICCSLCTTKPSFYRLRAISICICVGFGFNFLG